MTSVASRDLDVPHGDRKLDKKTRGLPHEAVVKMYVSIISCRTLVSPPVAIGFYDSPVPDSAHRGAASGDAR